ncbi:hypothetical protein PG987_007291 [Apiospora arundinis]
MGSSRSSSPVLDVPVSTNQSRNTTPEPDEVVCARTTCWELALKIFNTTLTKDPDKMVVASQKTTLSRSIGELVSTAEEAKRKASSDRGPFRQHLDRLLLAVSEYATVVDVMVQHHPDIVALVWGMLRGIFQIGVNEVLLHEEIGSGTSYVAMQIVRWDGYLGLHPAAPRVRATAAQLFAQVINFCVRSKRHYESSTVSKCIRAGITPAQNKIQRILSDIQRISQLLDDETRFESQRDIQKSMEIAQERTKECQQEDQVRRALKWLPTSGLPDESETQWEEGTCQWLFQHENWEKWKECNYMSVLWIYGIPGCGKSVLARYLSRHRDSSLVFTHLFQSIKGPKLNRSSVLAASILRQALQSQDLLLHPMFPSLLRTQITPLCREFNSPSECPFSRIWVIVDAVLSMLPEFTLIVDALDECSDEPDIRRQLIDKFNALSQTSNGRVILFSRQDELFSVHIDPCIAVHMDCDVVGSEVHLFAERVIDRTSELRSIKDAILDRVRSDAHGHFLWVRMMLKQLHAAPTKRLQEERLDRFPPDLAEVYEELLANASHSFSKDDLRIRRHLFTILIGAQRVLTIDEISDVLASRSSENGALINPAKTIRRLCWPLVDCSHEQARLIHASAGEFLLSRGPEFCVGSTRKEALIYDVATYFSHCSINVLRRYENATADTIIPLLRRNICPGPLGDHIAGDICFLNKSYDYVANYWHVHLIEARERLPKQLIYRLARWMDSPGFIVWVEYIFHCKGHSYLGPILSVRADLASWHAMLSPDLQSIIPLDTFLLSPYERESNGSQRNGQRQIERIMYLHRVAGYLNLRSMETERRYAIRKFIMEQTAGILGEHPFALLCATEFAVEMMIAFEYDQAEALFVRTSAIQRQMVGYQVSETFFTMCNTALVYYYQLKFDQAVELQELAVQGFARVLGPTHREYLRGRLFLGWALEAQENFAAASDIYAQTWSLWASMLSEESPLAMMARASLSRVERKQGRHESALAHGLSAFVNRQRVFGDKNTLTFDSAINLYFIYCGMADFDQARAILDLARSLGQGHQAQVRVCQLERLTAQLLLLEADQNLDEAETILRDLLQRAADEDWQPNRELLSARLDLARLLCQEHRESEALSLFDRLVEPVFSSMFHGSESSRRVVARKAAELLISNRLDLTTDLLRESGYVWTTPRYYWIPSGGPFMGV